MIPDWKTPQFTTPRCKYWLAVSLDKNALGVHLFLRQENWRNSTQPHCCKMAGLLQLAEVHLNGPRWVNGCSGVLLQFPSAHEVSRLLIGHAHYASIVVATFPVGHAKRQGSHESTNPEKDTVANPQLLPQCCWRWVQFPESQNAAIRELENYDIYDSVVCFWSVCQQLEISMKKSLGWTENNFPRFYHRGH